MAISEASHLRLTIQSNTAGGVFDSLDGGNCGDGGDGDGGGGDNEGGGGSDHDVESIILCLRSQFHFSHQHYRCSRHPIPFSYSNVRILLFPS